MNDRYADIPAVRRGHQIFAARAKTLNRIGGKCEFAADENPSAHNEKADIQFCAIGCLILKF
jgi:hypothetical protein